MKWWWVLVIALDVGLYLWGFDYRPRSWWRIMVGSGFYAAWRRVING